MSELTRVVLGDFDFKCTKTGKSYKVQHLNNKVEAAFERKQFERARDAAVLLKPCMSQGEYADHLHQLNEDFINGEYSLENKKGSRFAESKKGILILCSLLWQCEENEMVEIMMNNGQEVKSLLEVIIAESYGIDVEEIKKAQAKAQEAQAKAPEA